MQPPRRRRPCRRCLPGGSSSAASPTPVRVEATVFPAVTSEQGPKSPEKFVAVPVADEKPRQLVPPASSRHGGRNGRACELEAGFLDDRHGLGCVIAASSVRIREALDRRHVLERRLASDYLVLLFRKRLICEDRVVDGVRSDAEHVALSKLGDLGERQRPMRRACARRDVRPGAKRAEYFVPLRNAERPNKLVKLSVRTLTRGRLAYVEDMPARARVVAAGRTRSELPAVHLTLDRQLEHLWQRPWLEQDLLQLIPPEFALARHVAEGNEERCRNPGGLECRLRIVQVVCVAVVECDRHPSCSASFVDHLGQGGWPELLPDDLQVLSEVLRPDGEELRVPGEVLDAVVEQDAIRAASHGCNAFEAFTAMRTS